MMCVVRRYFQPAVIGFGLGAESSSLHTFCTYVSRARGVEFFFCFLIILLLEWGQ